MRLSNGEKTKQHDDLNDMINDFFSRGGAIEEVPTNIYRREELSLTNKAVLLEMSPAKVGHDRSKSGNAMRDANRINWEKRKMMGKI